MAVKKKGRTIKVDFSNVKDGGGGGVRVKEGDYLAHIAKVDLTEAKSSGNTMLVFYFQLWKDEETQMKGKQLRDNCVITEKALWRLRNLLLALGKKVPKSIANINVDGLLGDGEEPQLGITVVDGEEYNNSIRSEIAAYLTLDEFESDDEDEDEDEDDDEDEDEDDEELDEIDVDEI